MQLLTHNRWLLDFIRIRGLHFRLHATCLLLAGWLALDPNFSAEPTYTIVLLVSILASLSVHGMAHVIVASRCFANPQEVILHPLGAHVRYSKPVPSLQSLRIAMAGPISSFVLAALLWPFASESIVPVSFLDLTLFFTPLHLDPSISLVDRVFAANLFIAFINCLPILPLDGNSIFRDAFRLQRMVNAEGSAARLGQLTSAAIVFFASLEGNYFVVALGLFGLFSSTKSFMQARSTALTKDFLVGDLICNKKEPHQFSHGTALRDAALDAVRLPGSFFLVSDGSRLLGYVSKSSLLNQAASRSEPCALGEIAVRDFSITTRETPVSELLPKLQSGELSTPVLVVEDERALGILTVPRIIDYLLLQECFERDLEKEDDLYDF